jgi:multiple sugar transport system ATP-binding protein
MNFFDATLVGDANEMHVQSDTFKLKVPDEKAKVYAEKGVAGKEVVFGIRPNDIFDPDFEAANIYGQPVQSKVDVTEMMGNEIFLYLLAGGKEFRARVDPRSQMRVGQDVQVTFNMDHMQIFDRQTEMAVR